MVPKQSESQLFLLESPHGRGDGHETRFGRLSDFAHDGDFLVIEQFPETVEQLLLFITQKDTIGTNLQFVGMSHRDHMSLLTKELCDPFHLGSIGGCLIANHQGDGWIVAVGNQS